MQIEETGAASSIKEQIERSEEVKNQGGFEFQVVPLDDPRVFPSFKNKDIQTRFFKWGL
jgi:hypothetical protein